MYKLWLIISIAYCLATLCNTKDLPYTIPKEGAVLIFNCNASPDEELYWLLPNGSRIQGGTESDAYYTQGRQLVIHGVQLGMDGQYTCVRQNLPPQVFFVPYILAKTDYTDSLVISLMASAFFAIACAIVLLVDRYCMRSAQQVALITPESPELVRKQNLIAEAAL